MALGLTDAAAVGVCPQFTPGPRTTGRTRLPLAPLIANTRPAAKTAGQTAGNAGLEKSLAGDGFWRPTAGDSLRRLQSRWDKKRLREAEQDLP
jgi:hypothetical protein